MNQTPKRKNHWGSMIFLGIMLFITFFVIFKENSFSDLITAIKKANPIYIGVGVVFMLGFIFFQAVAIHQTVGYFRQKISLLRCIGYSFVGFYYSSITPSASGGQPMQMYYMCRDGISFPSTSIAMLLINISYQIVMLLYGVVMYAFRHTLVTGNKGIQWLLFYGALINFIVLLVMCFALFSQKAVYAVAKKVVFFLAKVKIVKNQESAMEKVECQLTEYAEGATLIWKQPLLFLKVFGLTFLQITALYLIPYVVYRAFGLQGHTCFDLVAVQAILNIAVSSLPLPGAVGATESGFVTMFVLFFSREWIVPAMLLSRGISFYSVILLSAIASFALHMIKNKKNRRIALTK